MTTQIQYRKDTSTNWTSNNPTLLEGEVGFESDTGLSKIGNGLTAWNSLLYQARNIFRLAANGAAIGPTIADFFANGAITLDVNSSYEIEYQLYFLKTTAGTVTFTLTSGQTPVNVAASYSGGPVAGIATAGAPIAAGIVSVSNTAAALPVTTSLTTGVSHHFTLRATVDTHATVAGTFKVQCTQGAGTLTPLRGSTCRIVRLPKTNIGAFA